jgi:hypothetical protein
MAWVVSFTARLFYPWEEVPVPVSREVQCTLGPFWTVWRRENLFHSSGFEPQSSHVIPTAKTRSFNVNPLTPNDNYIGRTALLTSKRCILYIYSTNIGTAYFKHGIYSPFSSLQNVVS